MFKDITSLPSKEIIKGIRARFVHTDNFTLRLYVSLDEGAVLPEHSHIHEQTSQVMEGELEMTIEGETTILKPGMIAIIPSNAKHSVKALTNCKVADTFCPVREDYK